MRCHGRLIFSPQSVHRAAQELFCETRFVRTLVSDMQGKNDNTTTCLTRILPCSEPKFSCANLGKIAFSIRRVGAIDIRYDESSNIVTETTSTCRYDRISGLTHSMNFIVTQTQIFQGIPSKQSKMDLSPPTDPESALVQRLEKKSKKSYLLFGSSR
jgi:hypothetical protein